MLQLPGHGKIVHKIFIHFDTIYERGTWTDGWTIVSRFLPRDTASTMLLHSTAWYHICCCSLLSDSEAVLSEHIQ